MLTSLAAIVGWVGLGALVGWIALRFIYEVADYAATKLREDALGHGSDVFGDVPALPSDLKCVSHSGTNSRKER